MSRSRIDDVRLFISVVHKYTPKDAWVAVSLGTAPSHPRQEWRTVLRQAGDYALIDSIEKADDRLQVYLRITPMAHRPTSGRGLEKDSLGSSVLWVDLDAYGKTDAALKALRASPMPPTLIVKSGNGIHAYWLLSELERDINAVKARNKALKQAYKEFNGDSCFDLARVLRVPGTYNLKGDEPVLAEVVEYHEDRVYQLGDFPEAILDDDDAVQLDASPEPLPDSFEDAIRAKKAKLLHRMVSAEGAPLAASGNVDHSRNDWYVACALLSLGYSQGVVMSVLMHPTWASGEKYRRSRNALYVLKTVGLAARHVQGDIVPAAGDKPNLYLPNGSYDVETLVAKAFELLLQTRDETGSPVIYRNTAGELCELYGDPMTSTPSIRTFNRHSLRRVVQQSIQWFTTSGKQERRPATVPDKVLDTMLARPNEEVPLLYRVVTVPTFVIEDGKLSLLSKPGYHYPSRIYYEPDHIYDDVPDNPSDEQLASAKSWILDELLHDFPFADDASLSHAVALLLLPFVRELIDGPTPFHLIDAPVQGSGKGLCVQALMSVYFGGTLNHTSEASSDDEWRKRLLSLARGGAQYLWIDNITKSMDWSSIAAALTSGSVTERLLGQSQVVTVPLRFAWMGTANNAVMNDDLLRRVAYIRLNWTSKHVEEPKELGPSVFKHFPLLQWARGQRQKLVWSALVMCQGGLRRGKSTANKNSFESWSEIMSTILNGVGINGFLENDRDLREMTMDATGDRVLDTIDAAVKLFGYEKTFTAKELAERMTDPTGDGFLLMPEGIKNPSRFFGIMLSQYRDRVVAGKHVIKRTGSKRDGHKWTILPYQQVQTGD